jgi:hypothetical protein
MVIGCYEKRSIERPREDVESVNSRSDGHALGINSAASRRSVSKISRAAARPHWP